jgi:hypothetical protein
MIVFQEHDAQTGISSRVHELDGRTVIQKTYDAEPFLVQAAAERAYTAGQPWGEMRKVGTIPAAVYATMLRQDGSYDPVRLAAWLKANPAFVSFDKFLT